MKFISLLSVQFSGFSYIYKIVQPSSHLIPDRYIIPNFHHSKKKFHTLVVIPYCPSPRLLVSLAHFLSLQTGLLRTCNITGTKQYVACRVRLISYILTFLRFIHIVHVSEVHSSLLSNNIPLFAYIRFCLFIYQLMNI